MPWRTTKMNDVRREFVVKALQRVRPLAALCREYGISRKTGWKWRERARAEGLSVLAEHSRRPRRSPQRLAEQVVCGLIRMKLAHPHWGPRKVCDFYAQLHGTRPGTSSCFRVLERAGLVERRRRRVAQTRTRLTTALVARAPNDVWTVDFKGWWQVHDGSRCEPLTVRDAYSRFILAIRLPDRCDGKHVRAEFERLFQLYGLPKVIRSDNGSPFAARSAPLGLSCLSAWWVTLGIELDRSRPGHPEDNGAHERFHRDMQRELATRLQPTLAAQQLVFDAWREEFNWERPHEALASKPPGRVYAKSSYSYPPAPLAYEKNYFVRKVNRAGSIKWSQQLIFISRALVGLQLGLRLIASDQLEVRLAYLPLGTIDLQTNKFRSAPSRVPEPVRLSA